jgi:hypothetical protein
MQHRLETPETAHWHSPLLKDLGFIRKHLRYPVNKRTILSIIPIIGSSVFLLLIATLFFTSINNGDKRFTLTFENIGVFFVVGLVFFTIGLAIYRRIQTLRFIAVKSDFGLNENVRIIRLFLEQQHIAYFHNPDAAEVFQIASRPLDRENDQREIMVFIADDYRVLINSHFSNEKGDRGIREISNKENRRMAKALKDMLEQSAKNNPPQFNRKITGS